MKNICQWVGRVRKLCAVENPSAPSLEGKQASVEEWEGHPRDALQRKVMRQALKLQCAAPTDMDANT